MRKAITIIKNALENAENHLSTIKIEGNIFEKYNNICMFENGTTVLENQKKNLIITSCTFAMQFNRDRADQICKGIKNGHGESPRVVTTIEYYTKKIEYLKMCLSYMKNNEQETIN